MQIASLGATRKEVKPSQPCTCIVKEPASTTEGRPVQLVMAEKAKFRKNVLDQGLRYTGLEELKIDASEAIR
jgi:hypothetical protein